MLEIRTSIDFNLRTQNYSLSEIQIKGMCQKLLLATAIESIPLNVYKTGEGLQGAKH
jgi:phosphoribosylformylglycinamidine (FGAM) synthase PurS component